MNNIIERLFALFAVNYDRMWLETMPDAETRQLKFNLWKDGLKNFKYETIERAGKEILKKCETYPPRIGEFITLCEEFSKTNRYQEFDAKKLQQLADDDIAVGKARFKYTADNPQAPMSPLLAEYMAKENKVTDESIKTARIYLDKIKEELRRKGVRYADK